MEAAVTERRARLDALRKRKADDEAGHSSTTMRYRRQDGDEDLDENVNPVVALRRFRSYDPLTGQAKKAAYNELEDTVEKDIQGVQEIVIAEDKVKRNEELDLTNIAPKKPNWDLKRDMERRLAKLERRDKEATLILIRQRINAAKKAANEAGISSASISAAEAELVANSITNNAERQGPRQPRSDSPMSSDESDTA